MFGDMAPKLPAPVRIPLHLLVGSLTAVLVTGGFRAAEFVRDARDRRIIAQQQAELRSE